MSGLDPKHHMDRGYFWIGLWGGVVPDNLGTLLRHAHILGAKQFFTVEARYTGDPSDTGKSWKIVPAVHYENIEDFYLHIPMGATLIGIERNGMPLSRFVHPERAVYILGAEDIGLTRQMRELCDKIVTVDYVVNIPYNVATCGTIVMWHRRFIA